MYFTEDFVIDVLLKFLSSPSNLGIKRLDKIFVRYFIPSRIDDFH